MAEFGGLILDFGVDSVDHGFCIHAENSKTQYLISYAPIPDLFQGVCLRIGGVFQTKVYCVRGVPPP